MGICGVKKTMDRTRPQKKITRKANKNPKVQNARRPQRDFWLKNIFIYVIISMMKHTSFRMMVIFLIGNGWIDIWNLYRIAIEFEYFVIFENLHPKKVVSTINYTTNNPTIQSAHSYDLRGFLLWFWIFRATARKREREALPKLKIKKKRNG